MSLPDIRLDDRRFQDIVDECRRLIPRYCPEWTDHNLSDPGITLIELFAWMTEVILYRLNRVPDKNYLKFLELIGLKLQPASPAKAEITFTLSAAQENPVTIPAGTEVSTVRTETEEAIVFCTERDLTILPPTLIHFFVGRRETELEDHGRAIDDPEIEVDIFQETPEPGDTFYLGFKENLSAHQLLITLKARIEGIGVDPYNPPIIWEVWHPGHNNWVFCDVESDTSGGFNRDGEITIHLPSGGDMKTLMGKNAFWLRCRATEPRPGQPAYSASPKISDIRVVSMGGTVIAAHSMKVRDEVLGISDGKPGQIFKTKNRPLLPRGLKEFVEVGTPGNGYERWQEVKDFYESGPEDPHYVIDEVMGEVQFGPAIRQPSGLVRQYGKVPREGAEIRFRQYRYGGGVEGNVGAGTLTVLKSSIPYVDKVINRKPASGGADPESLEQAKMRGPRLIKTINRAVTQEDYEYLAKAATPAVARAKCMQPKSKEGSIIEPGIVHLYIVPALKEDELRPSIEVLEISEHLKQEVYRYLYPRRLLTTMLLVKSPEYVWISIELLFKPVSGQEIDEAGKEVEKALYRYFHPLKGGQDGEGWPFGKEIFLPEIFAYVQRLEEVEYVEKLLIYPVDPETKEKKKPLDKIILNEWSLPYSYEHKVIVRE